MNLLPVMDFKITRHNLDAVLEAYERQHQPQVLTVPCDSWGNNIVIEAPTRFEVQQDLLYNDLCDRLKIKNNQVASLSYQFGTGLARVIGPTLIRPNESWSKLSVVQIAPGLTMFPRGREYVFSTSSTPSGLERINGITVRHEQWMSRGRRYVMETLTPGVSILHRE